MTVSCLNRFNRCRFGRFNLQPCQQVRRTAAKYTANAQKQILSNMSKCQGAKRHLYGVGTEFPATVNMKNQ